MDKNFPKEILFQSVDERINYFKEKSVAHPFLVNAYKDLKDVTLRSEWCR
jgi:hypothetical protein